MEVRKLAGAAVMCVALTVPTMAATSLCVETGSTGFNWRGGAWGEVTFPPEQQIVREIPLTNELAFLCKAEFYRNGLSAEIIRSEYGASRDVCVLMHAVGTEPSYSSAYVCRAYLTEDDAVSMINCDSDLFVHFKFEPSGEWVSTRTFAAPEISNTDPDRDSLAISVGKCSVIAP